MMTNMRSPVWHPFTQHALISDMKRIVKTEGAYLIDETGRYILDAISSWWVTTHGHRHPVIMEAISVACENWDQIIFAEFTHEPAEQLARALVELAPSSLKHVFFSDSGSTAIEVALKMALGFFKYAGVPRSRIVVMEYGYHGDTIGTMSVGERGVFNTAYEALLFKVDKIPFPSSGREENTLIEFTRLCEMGEVAALIIEPLVLGAGGFKMYPAWVLTKLKQIATQYGVLLIADEVMTGWGRTGSLFACEQAGISPDILCTSKGLTGGSLPLAATLCSSDIFAAHYSTDMSKTFFHSSSYTANPIACAAALANIHVWRTEPVHARIQFLQSQHKQYLAAFQHDKRFTSIRQIGTIAALDVNVESTGYLSSISSSLRKVFKQKNMLIRPLGNVIYLMPPYCIKAEELEGAYRAIEEGVDIVLKGQI